MSDVGASPLTMARERLRKEPRKRALDKAFTTLEAEGSPGPGTRNGRGGEAKCRKSAAAQATPTSSRGKQVANTKQNKTSILGQTKDQENVRVDPTDNINGKTAKAKEIAKSESGGGGGKVEGGAAAAIGITKPASVGGGGKEEEGVAAAINTETADSNNHKADAGGDSNQSRRESVTNCAVGINLDGMSGEGVEEVRETALGTEYSGADEHNILEQNLGEGEEIINVADTIDPTGGGHEHRRLERGSQKQI